ncbi:MAG: hypothetical protein ACF8PN_03110 [Phycisphaerales bacterium]
MQWTLNSCWRGVLLAATIGAAGSVHAQPGSAGTAGDLDAESSRPFERWAEDLDRSLGVWNDMYSHHVVALGWTEDSVIDSEAARAGIVAEITDPDLAWFASGDVSDPSTMTALQLADDPGISPEQIAAWITEVDSRVEVGHAVVRVEWLHDLAGPFESVCVVDSNGLIYDNMIFHMGGGAEVLGIAGRRVFDYRMWWAWQANKPWTQWTRGYIRADNNPVCRDGRVVSCDFNCTASMTLGDAKINCRSQQVPGQECCTLEYSWAWTTGYFKSISVGDDDFSLEIEGWVGSSASGNGRATVCCEGNMIFGGLELSGPSELGGGQSFEIEINNAVPNTEIAVAYAFELGATSVAICPGAVSGLAEPRLAGWVTADEAGRAVLELEAKSGLSGPVFWQAIEPASCRYSRVVPIGG